MKKYYNIFLITLTAFLFGACSNNDEPIIEQDDGMIEISYSQSKFDVSVWNGTRSAEFRAEKQVGTDSENAVDDIYVLMFKSDSDPIRYYSGATDTDPSVEGVWNKTNNIKLKVTQAEAGTRDVYVIANVGDLKDHLDVVDDLEGLNGLNGLKSVLQSNKTPWTASLGVPGDENESSRILMSGNATHNFVTNRILSSVPLIRALAKIELNVTLPTKHQDADASHYKYNFIDFDKNTYVLKPAAKTDELATSDWQPWQESSVVSSYTKGGDSKISSLKVVTYINERDNPGSYIDIQLPYNPGGPLPPPEFGGDTFKLPLPSKIERNYWYKFDVTL